MRLSMLRPGRYTRALPLPLLLLMAPVLLAVEPEQAVRAVLAHQVAAWNKGDIESFMTTYLDSPSITFTSSGGTTRGHRNVLERYRTRYSSREKMGTLRFDVDEVRILSGDVALALGRFTLTRDEKAGGPASGRFSLVLTRTSAGWKIVHDHTS